MKKEIAQQKSESKKRCVPFDPQVLLPYSQLIDLLETADKVDAMEARISHILDMQEALRCQLTEVMIAFGNLKRDLQD